MRVWSCLALKRFLSDSPESYPQPAEAECSPASLQCGWALSAWLVASSHPHLLFSPSTTDTTGRRERKGKIVMRKIVYKETTTSRDGSNRGGVCMGVHNEREQKGNRWSEVTDGPKVKKSQEVEAVSRDEPWALQACCIMWNYPLHKQRRRYRHDFI